MKPNRLVAGLLLLAASVPALAEVDRLKPLTRQESGALPEDVGAGLSYKPLQPIEPLGVLGFDIGVAATATKLKHPELLQRASSSGDSLSTVVVPSLRASLGLPWSFDLSAMYSSVPKTGAQLAGGALSWAFVSGGTWMPAIGVRASYTRLYGIDQLDFSTSGLDGSLSKGFGPFTPYIGAGKLWLASTPISTTGLQRETFSQTKGFGGISINISVGNFGVQNDKTGAANSYGGKL